MFQTSPMVLFEAHCLAEFRIEYIGYRCSSLLWSRSKIPDKSLDTAAFPLRTTRLV